MNNPLPKPLTPADSDLRDFPYMPIDIDRLFGSEFHAQSDDAAWRAGVTLWLNSFHQVPAASIPNGELALARLAELGRDTKTWRKIASQALRGWIACDDGRLYHPVVAEKALEAWIEKLSQRKSSAAGNAKRHGRPFDPTPFDNRIEAAVAMLAALNPDSRTLSRRSHRATKSSPDGTADPPLPTGAPIIQNGPPVGRSDRTPTIPRPPRDGSPDGSPDTPNRAPSGAQGKGREGKRREEILESSSSGTKPRARDRAGDDDLYRKLYGAANGHINRRCMNVGPIRELLDEGIPLQAIIACFRDNVRNLRQPLQTFGAEWLAIEARAHAQALAEAAARGAVAEKAIELVFVPVDSPQWPLAEARYERERGRKPPRDSRGPDGTRGLGWMFTASWPECHPATPHKAAE